MPDGAHLAHGWRDALVGRDPDAFAALFTEDAVFIDVEHRTDDLGSIRPQRGREEIRAMCVSWLASTPAFDYEVERVLAEEDAVAVRWRYRVEGLDVPGVSWLTVRDGLIAEAFVVFDSLGLYRGLGRV